MFNGAPAEVVTDQGTEWRDEFHELLQSSYIDHRTTSAYHPQANGLTERAVQTMKRALTKMAYAAPDTCRDEHLPYATLGYNASVQQSTGFSPYHMLHAVPPTLPSSIRPRFDTALDLDDSISVGCTVRLRALPGTAAGHAHCRQQPGHRSAS